MTAPATKTPADYLMGILTVIGGFAINWLGQKNQHLAMQVAGIGAMLAPVVLNELRHIFALWWAGPHTFSAFIADAEDAASEAARASYNDAANHPDNIAALAGKVAMVLKNPPPLPPENA